MSGVVAVEGLPKMLSECRFSCLVHQASMASPAANRPTRNHFPEVYELVAEFGFTARVRTRAVVWLAVVDAVAARRRLLWPESG